VDGSDLGIVAAVGRDNADRGGSIVSEDEHPEPIQPERKKPYSMPQLKRHGTVQDLTQGGLAGTKESMMSLL
jgi:hypothetical protein